jgi:hypothetical protein
MITAFGIMLACAGLVTYFAVSAVGLLLLFRGAIGWWRDVLPQEEAHHVPITTWDRFAWPPEVSRRVDYLIPGEAGHRPLVPLEYYPYRAGFRAGIAGGIAMAVVASIFGLIVDRSIWYPVNLLAAGIVPSLAAEGVAQLKQFSMTGLVCGILIHGFSSILVGLLYAVALPMFPRRAGLLSGLVTPVLWSGLIAGVLEIINPTLNSQISWPWFVASQIAFGLTAGFVVSRSAKLRTMQTWPFAHRAGLESLGPPPTGDQ